ncbi:MULTISPECIES: hypothetical protein [Paenibacillus]|nr:hypothetical protein [Paenibacillus odorifer]
MCSAVSLGLERSVVEKWWSFGADVVGNCANGNGQMSGRSNV